MYLIEYKNLYKRFAASGGVSHLVLNRINLRIKQGEFVTLVGGSGSGKTTLFNHLLGTMRQSSGELLVGGKPVEGVAPDRGIVPQRYALFPNMNVRDNIAFGILLSETTIPQRLSCMPSYWRTRRKAREQAQAMLSQLGLEPADGDRFPHEFSGGMRQRVAIGTSVIMKPKILMMDEPFGALDPETGKLMQKLILRIWKEQNLTIIFVTHRMEEAVYLGTRIIGLSKYWTDEQGQPGEGSRIVLDREIPEPHPRPDSFEETEAFSNTCSSIRRLVLDTTRRVPVELFDRSHPDAAPIGPMHGAEAAPTTAGAV